MGGLEVRFLASGALLLWLGGFVRVGINFLDPGGSKDVSDAPSRLAGYSILLGTLLLWFAVGTRGAAMGKLPGGNLYETVTLLAALIPSSCLVITFRLFSTSGAGAASILAGSLAAWASTLPLSWPGPAPSLFDPVMMGLHAYPAMIALCLTLLGSATASASLGSQGSIFGCLIVSGFLATAPGAAATAFSFWTTAGSALPPMIAGPCASSGFFAIFLAVFSSRGWRTGSLQITTGTPEEDSKIAATSAKIAAAAYLVFGIGAGMVWAAMAWGRPWGWDMKETGALLCTIFYVTASMLFGLSSGGGEKRQWAASAALLMTAAGGVGALLAFIAISVSAFSLHGYGGR